MMEQAFVDAALSFCGAPYIWGGKGYDIFKDGKLVMHPFKNMDNQPMRVFDCSGVITCALRIITHGAIDLRGSHSAKTIWDTFPEATGDFGKIMCYQHHVAISLGNNLVLDANRGDERCTTILHAHQEGAQVEVHRNLRPSSTLLGYRRIPVDIKELRSV